MIRRSTFLGFALCWLVAATAAAAPVQVTFQWEGSANQVYLAGEFNSWNPQGKLLTDDDGDGVFTATIALEPGTYAYKFVIDGTWKEDPLATATTDDGFGGKNSVLTVPAGIDAMLASESKAKAAPAATQPAQVAEGNRRVRFRMVAPGAKQVFVAGEFNGWNASGQAMADPDGDGVFEAVMDLEPRRWAYKYVIDGTWKEDPHAADFVDDGFGGKNGVVEVVAGEGIQDAGDYSQLGESTMTEPAASPATATGEAVTGSRSVTFRYTPVIGGVNEVFLAGTFNDWNVGATPMADADGDGTYEATLLLGAGSYQYKFVVDGNWITPDDADDYADDGFGGQNGVIHVDARFEALDVEKGDGAFFLKGMDVALDYSTVNEPEDGLLIFQAKVYRGDVEGVVLHLREGDAQAKTVPMKLGPQGPVNETFQTKVRRSGEGPVRFTFEYRDGGKSRFATLSGAFVESAPAPAEWFVYSEETLPRFRVPQWAQKGIYYQIFPDRFANGDPSNDQKFEEPYYQGRKALPPSGKVNGEYFHFVDDWNDVSGLSRSPYRTDGKPDYFSFYGGDIRGIMDKIPYLVDLGVTIVYFNPITEGRSNHRYDPCDYQAIDPHLGTEAEFQEFTRRCLDEGIRVIVDMAYNHSGDCHFAFQNVLKNGTDSPYYDWYEWKKIPQQWPLPAGSNALDYYDCWWGFGLHPNLNFDLRRPNAQENGIADIEDAEVNWDVVNNLLGSVDYWLGKMGCSGFRLDVPNEVPFWFWDLFRQRCREVKQEHILIGEIWGDAGQWINPDVFDAVMNYKFFRDPVWKWIGQKQGNAATFDQELAPGRTQYPIQSVRGQMNLIDSHDTVRFLHLVNGDTRRLQLAATFAMTYVGAPHIYYGDELALTGDRDPDCRRTMPWDQIDLPARKETLEHYQAVTALRHRYDALTLGDFQTVLAQGDVYSYLREHQGQRVLVVLNNGNASASVDLPVGNVGIADGTDLSVTLGDEAVLAGDRGRLAVKRGILRVGVPAVSGAVLVVGSSATGR